MRKYFLTISLCILCGPAGFSQALDFTAIRAEVDFSRTFQEWDGFGFNYVETAHSSDMEKFNQEYGGSILQETVLFRAGILSNPPYNWLHHPCGPDPGPCPGALSVLWCNPVDHKA